MGVGAFDGVQQGRHAAFGVTRMHNQVDVLRHVNESDQMELVRSGLEILRGTSCPFVIVLGHPDYYPRFGFQRGVSGVAKYAEAFDEAYTKLTAALRPWTIDLHIAQNDATVKGSGSHDKTGRHCLPNDPGGKLDIPRHAGYWLRDEKGELTKKIRHICWDGCMFPNETMMKPGTWNDVLAAMLAVRDAHGWVEEE